MMPDTKLPRDLVIAPQKQECFRHEPFRQIFPFCKREHLRQCLIPEILEGNTVPFVCQAIFINGHIADE